MKIIITGGNSTEQINDAYAFINNILSFTGYKILKKFNYINLEENAGDFRLISKRVIKEIINLNETSNFRFLVDFVGFKREKILYQRQAREYGQSKFGFKSVVFNFLEYFILSKIFWDKNLNKNFQYTKKQINKPLIISFLILVFISGIQFLLQELA